jgi:hypothetical protein
MSCGVWASCLNWRLPRTTAVVLDQTRRHDEDDPSPKQKPDDAVDALAVQDSLAGRDRVAIELDAMPSATTVVFHVEHLAGLGFVRSAASGRDRFGGERGHDRLLQVAVTP